MKFCITTQYMENYGDVEKPYWKYKGADEYIIDVPGFRFDDMAYKKGRMIVDELSEKFEYRNDYSQEYIVDWKFVEDDYQTESELFQLEYDGEIAYPAKRLSYDDLMKEENVYSL